MLNRFSSPMEEGTYRAFINMVATLVVTTLTTYATTPLLNNQTGIMIAEQDRWKFAIIAGVIAALTPFVGGTAMAASDQSRANKSETKPANVPNAIRRAES